MKMTKTIRNLCALLIFSFLSPALLSGDTIYFKNGGFVKGRIIKEYHDRYLVSTSHGEKEFLKVIVKNVGYDNPKERLMSQGKSYEKKGNFEAALRCYEDVLKMDEGYSEAREKIIEIKKKTFRKQTSKSDRIVANRGQLGRWNPDTTKKEQNLLRLKESRLKKTVGIEVQEHGPTLTIAKVMTYSPAYDAGLQARDTIVRIDDKDIKYMEYKDVLELLDGAKYTELKIDIERELSVPKGTNHHPLECVLTIGKQGLKVERLIQAKDFEVKNTILKEGDVIVKIQDTLTRYLPLKDAIQNILKSNLDYIDITVKRTYTVWRE